MSSNKIIVSYGDAILREKDLELLSGPYWLNDNVISFYFEYLSLNVFQDLNNVLFVSPEVTLCLKASNGSDIEIFLEPLSAKCMKYILFPLNDQRNYGASGGTHWSLLVYSSEANCMYHLDSMSPTNFQQGARLTAKLVKYLAPDGCADFKELPCLQQNNSYDCGIFVIAHAEYLISKCVNGLVLEDCPKISESAISSKREDVLSIALKLSQTKSHC